MKLIVILLLCVSESPATKEDYLWEAKAGVEMFLNSTQF
jgi:hypothetical protein